MEVKPEDIPKPDQDIKSFSTEAEQIGNKVVKVQFIEFVGRRKKKVTHIEVTQAELADVLKNKEKNAVAQLSMF